MSDKVTAPVAELEGIALDWAVARCEELLKEQGGNLDIFGLQLKVHPSTLGTVYTPSTDWEQAGSIIMRERIGIEPWGEDLSWVAQTYNEAGQVLHRQYGHTPLVAAMRCHVESQLGPYVTKIPSEFAEYTQGATKGSKGPTP
jgi:hypothetical protein